MMTTQRQPRFSTRRLLTTLGAAGLAATLAGTPAALAQSETSNQASDAQKTQKAQQTQRGWTNQNDAAQSQRNVGDQNQDAGYIVVRRIYAVDLADAPGDSMDQAQQQIKQGNHAQAADSLKRAATFLKIEADNTDKQAHREALMKAAKDLEQSAEQVRDGNARTEDVNRSMADASRSLSDARYDRGSRTWDQTKQADQWKNDRGTSPGSNATRSTTPGAASDRYGATSRGDQSNSSDRADQARKDFESAANFRDRAAQYEQQARDSDTQAAQEDQQYSRDLRLIAGRMESVRTPADQNERQAAADQIDQERRQFDQRYGTADEPYATGAYRDDTRSTQIKTDESSDWSNERSDTDADRKSSDENAIDTNRDDSR